MKAISFDFRGLIRDFIGPEPIEGTIDSILGNSNPDLKKALHTSSLEADAIVSGKSGSGFTAKGQKQNGRPKFNIKSKGLGLNSKNQLNKEAKER